jgi:hypothetical protein
MYKIRFRFTCRGGISMKSIIQEAKLSFVKEFIL